MQWGLRPTAILLELKKPQGRWSVMDHRLAAALSVVDSEKTSGGYPMFIAESDERVQWREVRAEDAGAAMLERMESQRREKKDYKPEHGVTYYAEPYLDEKDGKWPTREEWLKESEEKRKMRE